MKNLAACLLCLLPLGPLVATPAPDFLAKQLEAKAKSSKAPAEVRKIMADATRELRKSNILKTAKTTGQTAPNFTLSDAQGKPKSLKELLKNGSVILTFYRGGWCPYCNLQLRAYQKVLPEFEQLGATLVAISPEQPDSSLSTTQKNSLKFEILSDPNNLVAKSYGIVFKLPQPLVELYEKFGIDLKTSQGNSANELPIPATYVIDKNGKITYAFLDVDYKKRAEPSEIIQALRQQGS